MKKKFEWNRLLNEWDEDDNGGGLQGANDIWDDSSTYEEDGDGGDDSDYPDDDGDGDGYPQVQDPVVPMSAIREIVQGLQPQVQPQQMTPEMAAAKQKQIDEQLKVFRPDAAFAQKLFGGDASDDQVEALNAFTRGIVEHLTTVMGYANQLTRQDLEQRYSPALEAVTEQKTQLFTGIMTERFPALKGKETAIRHVVQQLNQQGYRPANEQEALQTVARHVEAIVKMSDPNFTVKRRPQQQQSQSNHAPQMAGLSGGSGGAAAGAANKSSGGNKKKPGWLAIWD